MKIKWSFIDLDGTLLNRRRHVSLKNLNTLREYSKNGGNIVISTGRWPISALKINNDIEEHSGNKNKYLIAMNGANIFDLENNKLIFEKHIDNEIIKNILDYISGSKIAAWIYSKNGIENRIIYSVKIPLKKIISKFNYGKIVELDQSQIDNDLVFKILLMSYHKSLINNVIEWIKKEYDDELSIVKINAKTIEITARNISKGSAIEFIQNIENFKLDEIASLGDSQNDYSMFKLCKYNICFNNSEKDLSKLATISVKNQNNFDKLFKKYIIDFNEYENENNESICLNLENWFDNLNSINISNYPRLENYLISQNKVFAKVSIPIWLSKEIFWKFYLSKESSIINEVNVNFEDEQIKKIQDYLKVNVPKILIIEYKNKETLLVYKTDRILNHYFKSNILTRNNFRNRKPFSEIDLETDLNKNVVNVSVDKLDLLDHKLFKTLKSKNFYHIYLNTKEKTSENLVQKNIKEFSIKEYKNINNLLENIEKYLNKKKDE